MRFLIVDDDITTRHILAGILRSHGETFEAVNGAEAVKAFKLSAREHSQYAAIFVDIMMPEMDGNTAVSQIREFEKKIHRKPSEEVNIIMLSALDDPKNVMSSFNKSGATSYVVKPVTREKIENELKKLRII